VISLVSVSETTYFFYWLMSSVMLFLVDKQTKWCKEDGCLIKILRIEKGYGARRLISEFLRKKLVACFGQMPAAQNRHYLHLTTLDV